MPGMTSFVERHTAKIRGVLSCFDRGVITGTLPDICHADAMARYLSAGGVRLFDYPRWAEPFRDELRAHTGQVPQVHVIESSVPGGKGLGWKFMTMAFGPAISAKSPMTVSKKFVQPSPAKIRVSMWTTRSLARLN